MIYAPPHSFHTTVHSKVQYKQHAILRIRIRKIEKTWRPLRLGWGPLEPFVSATGNSGGRGLDPSADPVVGPLWEVGRLHFAVATYISHLFLHGSAKNESESERVPFPFPFPLHD
ncbi:hypothetical protein GW17_00037136 [Ensete ventricosum]|nr:hypothetical protein GW17_00037136 [Ensete ventricosum]